MSKTSYIKEQHNRDCSAIRLTKLGDWNHPLFIKGDSVYATKNGVLRKGGGTTRFTIVRCNDPQCGFLAWVNSDAIEEHIYRNML